MHVAEMDFRYSWTKETLDALEGGLRTLQHPRSDGDAVDGIDLLERADHIAGLGFVSLQVYVAGTLSDLRKVLGQLPCPVQDLLPRYGAPLAGQRLKDVEVIWHVANYWKHHDEWDAWTVVGPKGQKTIRALAELHISEETEFPCVCALESLQGGRTTLAGSLEMARAWRERCFRTLNGGTYCDS